MSYMLAIIASVFAAFSGRLGIALLRANPDGVAEVLKRMPTAKDAIFGRVRVFDEQGIPDPYVTRGMIFNERENRIEVCGRVNEAGLERAFR